MSESVQVKLIVITKDPIKVNEEKQKIIQEELQGKQARQQAYAIKTQFEKNNYDDHHSEESSERSYSYTYSSDSGFESESP